jgi:quinol monooxygenase YgiN
MVTLLAELKVKADKVEEAKVAFRKLMETVKSSEPGTLTYTIHQRNDDPHTFVVYERYVDDAAFQTHMGNLATHGAGLATVLEGAPAATFLTEL